MKKFCKSLFAVFFFALVFVVASNAQQTPPDSTGKQKTATQEKDRPLEIEHKPFAKTGNCPHQSRGLTRLRVTFDKSAKVTNAKIVISSGCDDFDREAVKAAGGIRFKPAIKNGEPVTVSKLIEYKFRKQY
ncbi:MAG TPA: energy transducer TonB [Pyrinomonadaceae bacterium]|jgi:TonB family protein